MLSRLFFWRKPRAVVPVIRMSGVIASGGGLRRGVSLEALEPQLKKAFSMRHAKAVALIINSPGGSPVQSALIGQRVRDLARKADGFWLFVRMLLPAAATGWPSVRMKSMPMQRR